MIESDPEARSESDGLPFVTAIIPCRNEERHIAACLESIIANDYPKDRLEALVVDGLSDDNSRQVAQGYADRYEFIRVLDNPKQILAAAWNVGIREGKGDILISMNAHATIEPAFVSKCVRYLEEYGADCVGPVLATAPQDPTMIGNAIATAMSHPFGVGGSRFRVGITEPEWVDTVHCGACRREVFERVGVYNEELVRSQDIELHNRMRSQGVRILLVPDITISYFTRSDPKNFVRYGFINGFWVTFPFRFGTVVAGARHMTPMLFVSGIAALACLSFVWPAFAYVLGAVLAIYLSTACVSGVHAAIVGRRVSVAFLLPLVCITYHVLSLIHI